ncbi:MAG: hypothetical protein UU64_C0003G0053 [candidate division WWE3 bacterium GW2011_GWF2_41_45]|uniref:Uncharacterized protein n=2 Tax=Katanobacteria TaxID=422282 RepID=A0A1F4W292_UNCKA|nr:MAG: hypothetical protein UU55_C0003G0084 [candidate division WWE3 bacterium GW2011_GWC2_41_23]KKS10544.1 MAG: hypothetical protein UU64_C0003G0053 [candidate division WWE3 bacterium GW2011_GWF2_41_45]KKS20261.1 MAG: hypothetical protein UU79_C0002G0027 [candidate division WWE3 bacterium GW2011_GWE1_41_72]KKS28264.1 MAG: hypothetical protein UU86_C0006G0011 [candidate division WWE3 bacterium GW2011_GWC1_42_102]KKS30263.1 MAG: hypothetical protein UU90_C0003G0003 [candidate division WWE3 bact
MYYDNPRTYNKALTIPKTLSSGNHEIQISITPFQEVTVRMEARVNGKLVDTYMGKEEPSRSNFPVKWWIEKYTPRGKHWTTELVKWYTNEVLPVIEAETVKRNILHPSNR